MRYCLFIKIMNAHKQNDVFEFRFATQKRRAKELTLKSEIRHFTAWIRSWLCSIDQFSAK